jgi:adenylate cyclase
VAGWVFVNREPASVNNAYEDPRFYREIDDMTGFKTRNLICTPLLLNEDQCLGTIQSLNKREGNFTKDDLELLKLAANMVAVAINNSRRYKEMMVMSQSQRKFIKQITANVGNIFDKK